MPVYSASFIPDRSRFDDTASMRRVKSRRELLLQSNLGPGYVDSSLPKSDRCKYSFSKASRDQRVQSAAPGVGTYTLPRFSSGEHDRVSRRHPQIVSAFLSSGRTKELGYDATYYRTIRDDVLSSNRGPGLYEIPSYFSPGTINAKTNEFPSSTKHLFKDQGPAQSAMISRSTLRSAGTQWR